MTPYHQTADEIILDNTRLTVRIFQYTIRLTQKEFDLLKILQSEPDRVFHRIDLLSSVWGTNITVEPRTVDAHIVKLRRKLRIAGMPAPTIETVWGLGYRLRSIMLSRDSR